MTYSSFSKEDLEFILMVFLKKESPESLMSYLKNQTLKDLKKSKEFFRQIVLNINQYTENRDQFLKVLCFLTKELGEFFDTRVVMRLCRIIKNEKSEIQLLEFLTKENKLRLRVKSLFSLLQKKLNAKASPIYFRTLIQCYMSIHMLHDHDVIRLLKFIHYFNNKNPDNSIRDLDILNLRAIPLKRIAQDELDNLPQNFITFLSNLIRSQ